MKILRKILLPTDFSKLSEVAKDYVLMLKGDFEQEVIVLHVLSPVEVSLPQFDDPFALEVVSAYAELPEVEKEILKKIESMLNQICAELEEAGFKTKKVISVGNPKEQIVEVAKRENVSLIVIGYHGKGLVEKILEMGSTAKAVVKSAECPVLVVKAKQEK